ncbi:hypothetical protein V6N13_098934 [Hibiscus sabdariffa]|uniref:Uncharacterized protein n=1 Tax=Hibiscus sabdariffa TaxID=183260 RepID=A0ABR2P973_9ROSI
MWLSFSPWLVRGRVGGCVRRWWVQSFILLLAFTSLQPFIGCQDCLALATLVDPHGCTRMLVTATKAGLWLGVVVVLPPSVHVVDAWRHACPFAWALCDRCLTYLERLNAALFGFARKRFLPQACCLTGPSDHRGCPQRANDLHSGEFFFSLPSLHSCAKFQYRGLVLRCLFVALQGAPCCFFGPLLPTSELSLCCANLHGLLVFVLVSQRGFPTDDGYSQLLSLPPWLSFFGHCELGSLVSRWGPYCCLNLGHVSCFCLRLGALVAASCMVVCTFANRLCYGGMGPPSQAVPPRPNKRTTSHSDPTKAK